MPWKEEKKRERGAAPPTAKEINDDDLTSDFTSDIQFQFETGRAKEKEKRKSCKERGGMGHELGGRKEKERQEERCGVGLYFLL